MDGTLPHPLLDQLLCPPNHNISQAYSNGQKEFEEGEEHCRRKWKLNHSRIVAWMCYGRHQI